MIVLSDLKASTMLNERYDFDIRLFIEDFHLP